MTSIKAILMIVILLLGCQSAPVQCETIIGHTLYTSRHDDGPKDLPIESELTSLDDAHFDEAIKGPSVFVEWYANWCGNCRAIAPSLDSLQKRHPNTRFFRVDVDANPISSDRQEVKMVPEMIIFKHGKRMGSLVGAYPDAVLDRFVRTTL
jgi:thioredoxin 1